MIMSYAADKICFCFEAEFLFFWTTASRFFYF